MQWVTRRYMALQGVTWRYMVISSKIGDITSQSHIFTNF
jgi:hypothetical protein